MTGRRSGNLESLAEILAKNPDYPDLTRELRTTGKITYHNKNPQMQAIERECLLQLHDIKTELELEHENFIAQIKLIETGKPKDLMEMPFETVLMLLEKVRGNPCENFDQVLYTMSKLQGSEIEQVLKQDKIKPLGHLGLGRVSEETEEWALESGMSAANLPVMSKAPSTSSSRSGEQPLIFPTSSEMNGLPSTPSSQSVYQFGSSVMSTNKAPRLFKPGEMAFSQSGSPLLMPKLGARGKRQETIPVNDADGKKIVEVVLYRGEDDKEKEYKDYVTDIRGLVATKSIKQNRVRPPRLPRGDPGSAAKKRWQ